MRYYTSNTKEIDSVTVGLLASTCTGLYLVFESNNTWIQVYHITWCNDAPMFTHLASLPDLWFTVIAQLTLDLSQRARHTTHYTWRPGDRVYVLFQIQQEPKCLDTLNAANCTGASPIEIICFGPGGLAGGGGIKVLPFIWIRALGPSRGYILIQLSLPQSGARQARD